MNTKQIKSKMTGAFSLIELMVVIAIIALLTGVALPAYTQYMAQSKVAEIFSLASNQMSLYSQYYSTGYNNSTTFDVCTPSPCSSIPALTTANVGNYIAYAEIHTPANNTTAKNQVNTYSTTPVIVQLTTTSSGSAYTIDPSLAGVTLGFTATINSNSSDTADTTMTWTCAFNSPNANTGNTTYAQTASLLKAGNCGTTSVTVN